MSPDVFIKLQMKQYENYEKYSDQFITSKENTMAYQECAKEAIVSSSKRDPEIHTLIQELHGLIGAQAEAIDMLESRLSTVSASAPPTAPGQPIGCPVESPIGNELFSMKMRLQSILEQTREIRSRLCV